MKTPSLIGLVGVARAGKDTAAQVIENDCGHEIVSFAGPLKVAVEELFQVNPWSGDREEIDPYWGISVREILQKFGTEAMRATFGDDFWLRCLGRNLPSKAVITDVRFENEAGFVKQRGGLLLGIERPGAQILSGGHVSEFMAATRLHDVCDIVVVNDSSIEIFQDRVVGAILDAGGR